MHETKIETGEGCRKNLTGVSKITKPYTGKKLSYYYCIVSQM